MPTNERLARALEAEMAPAYLIERARSGVYDDIRSQLTFPLTALIMKLHSLGLRDLAQRAIDGEFDSTAEEWAAWAESDEGRAATRSAQESV